MGDVDSRNCYLNQNKKEDLNLLNLSQQLNSAFRSPKCKVFLGFLKVLNFFLLNLIVKKKFQNEVKLMKNNIYYNIYILLFLFKRKKI